MLGHSWKQKLPPLTLVAVALLWLGTAVFAAPIPKPKVRPFETIDKVEIEGEIGTFEVETRKYAAGGKLEYVVTAKKLTVNSPKTFSFLLVNDHGQMRQPLNDVVVKVGKPVGLGKFDEGQLAAFDRIVVTPAGTLEEILVMPGEASIVDYLPSTTPPPAAKTNPEPDGVPHARKKPAMERPSH